MAGRPMKRLQARTLAHVRTWMLDESKPLSFVLEQLNLTPRRWEDILTHDEPLRDLLALVSLKEEEAFLDKLKQEKGVVGSIFALKARHAYVDQNKPAPPEAPPPNVNVTVMLPEPAKNADEWNRIINVTPKLIEVDDDISGLIGPSK